MISPNFCSFPVGKSQATLAKFLAKAGLSRETLLGKVGEAARAQR